MRRRRDTPKQAPQANAISLDDVESSPIARFRDIVQRKLDVNVPQMVRKCYEERAENQAAIREKERRAVTTAEAWEAERQRFRADYETALGFEPPVNIEVVDKGTLDKDDVVIRKLLFTSFEGNWIPANLYLPRDADGPLPAVINACGHNDRGKTAYVERGLMLARNGYVGLTFDLPGMGERRFTGSASGYPASTHHNIFGCKLILAGGSLARIFVQDASAAVSVLQQTDEVDSERIGITGSSGGGWLSVHAAALDERIKVVVPAASVRTLHEHVAPDDAEQMFVDLERLGIDFPDLFAFLICPRPIFVVANSKDAWPISMVEYVCREASRTYALLGHEDRVAMKVWDRGHTYQPDQFAEAIRWFNRFLRDDPDAPVTQACEDAEQISPEDLLACKNGSVLSMGASLPSVAYWKAIKPQVCSRKDITGFLDYLKTNTEVPDHVPWAETDTFDFGSGPGKRICYAPEDGILLPADVLFPPNAQEVAILLDEVGRRYELDWQLGVAAGGAIAVRPDLRGWGEAAAEESYRDWEGWAQSLYASSRYRLHVVALMAGRSLVLDRARDVRALLNVVGELAPGLILKLHGRRGAAWVALLAALVDGRVDRLVLERYTASFVESMECDMPVQYPDLYLPDLLTWGVDVSDLIEAFDGELITREPLDAQMQPRKE